MGLPFCRNGALGYHTERVIISFAPYTFPRLIKIVELDRYFFVLQYFFFLYLNLLVPSLPCIYNRIAFFCVSSDFFFFSPVIYSSFCLFRLTVCLAYFSLSANGEHAVLSLCLSRLIKYTHLIIESFTSLSFFDPFPFVFFFLLFSRLERE